MGQEVKSASYTKEQEIEFLHNLKEETKWLCRKIKAGDFPSSPLICGYEAEGWIIDSAALPSAVSAWLLKSLNDPRITPELSQCNFEINGRPFPVNQALSGRLKKDMRFYWEKCLEAAKKKSSRVMFIGAYPDLSQISFGLEKIYPRNRYHAINRRIHDLRKGPARINIEGREALRLTPSSIMLEAATTSLQIHLQTGFAEAKPFYNSSLMASPIMAALCANSPYIFGKELWEESRIPLFEQVISLTSEAAPRRRAPRAGLGHGFVRESLSELFEQNLSHPVLLPEPQKGKIRQLRHLLLHNGTIWRWNRPLIGFDEKGRPHFRIEHRVPSSGPSLVDMRANIFFFIGLLHGIKKETAGREPSMAFSDLESGFRLAAKKGLSAEIKWLDGSKGKIRDLILRRLIPLAWEELKRLSLDSPETDELINDVIKNRADSGQTGSFWQKAYIRKFGKRFDKMVEAYWQNQKGDIPVCRWKV